MAMIGIVPEVLKEENYEFWKECLESYIAGQGLWDVIKGDAKPEDNQEEWKKKNAKALHAIQLACGSQAYHKYKKNTTVSAKTAWEHLVELDHRPSHHPQVTIDQDKSGPVKVREDLYKAVKDDNIKKVKEILENDTNAGKAIVSPHGDTALHVAVLEGKMKMALELVKLMPPEGLEIFNKFDAIPLSLVAITENVELAKEMVNKNPKVVEIKGKTDENALPVIVASMYGRKKMVKYLYSMTPESELDPENRSNGSNGVLLLNNLITADLFGE